jgi:hypothetical protein
MLEVIIWVGLMGVAGAYMLDAVVAVSGFIARYRQQRADARFQEWAISARYDNPHLWNRR